MGRAARSRPRGRPAPEGHADAGGDGGRRGDGASPAHQAVTGRPFEAVLFQPAGEEVVEARYRHVPQFAVGQWWTAHPDVAATYGPRVRRATVRLENPYVFRLPGRRAYFHELRQEMGTADPHEVTARLKTRGHDGLVVTNVPVNRFRLDTGEGVAMRDSAELIVFVEAEAGD